MTNYYDTLDLELNASEEEVRNQYKQLVRIYHPDRFRDAKDKIYAEEKLKEINLAYQTLSNPTQRDLYDQQRYSYSNGTPPVPTVTPGQVDFGILGRGSKKSLKFQIGNSGGEVQNLNLYYSDEDTWFKVTKGRRLNRNQPVPMEIEVTADTRSLEAGENYGGWIEVNMDNQTLRVPITVLVSDAKPTSQLVQLTPRLAVALGVLIVIIVSALTTLFVPSLRMGINALRSSTPALSSSPALTPQQLLYTGVEENGQRHFYRSLLNGATQERIDASGQQVIGSPTQEQIAFLKQQGEMTQLYRMDLENQTLVQLTKDSSQKRTPLWSPDGKAIAYIAAGDSSESRGDLLQVVDVNGAHIQALVPPKAGQITHHAWDADNRLLLFDLKPSTEAASQLYQADVETGDVRLFSEFEGYSADWLPNSADGPEGVVVVASAQGVHLLSQAGEVVQQLSKLSAWSTNWSFDGQQIAFLSDPDEENDSYTLWVIEWVDEKVRLRNISGGVLAYSWSPDSNHLAYITGNMTAQSPVLYLWTTVPNDGSIEPTLVAEVDEPHLSWIR